MHATIVLVFVISYYCSNLITIFCSIKVINALIDIYYENIEYIEITKSVDIFQILTKLVSEILILRIFNIKYFSNIKQWFSNI